MAHSHYENFIVASVLLPRAMRQPFYDVYAYCRFADDVADETGDPNVALKELEQLESHIHAIYAGSPPRTSFYPALAATIGRYRLPKKPFLDLLDAFRQDQSVSRYESLPQLEDYCRCSANPVGRLVLALAGAEMTDENLADSDSICTALQLANFWQDVKRDHAIGRLYVPQDRLLALGLTPEDLQPVMDGSCPADSEIGCRIRQQFSCVIKDLCQDTRARFQNAGGLIHRVPEWLAADLWLFIQGGLATLDAIQAIDHDVLVQRPIVSRWKQLQLVARASWSVWRGRS